MSVEIITIGGGCFWCIEAVMQRVKGVTKVESGYSGGLAPGYPTYREVCSGLTGHAEVVRVTFENEEISLRDLLTIFMTLHDPTQLNGQGADLGTQYRSVIYYQSDDQRATADAVFIELKENEKWQLRSLAQNHYVSKFGKGQRQQQVDFNVKRPLRCSIPAIWESQELL